MMKKRKFMISQNFEINSLNYKIKSQNLDFYNVTFTMCPMKI